MKRVGEILMPNQYEPAPKELSLESFIQGATYQDSTGYTFKFDLIEGSNECPWWSFNEERWAQLNYPVPPMSSPDYSSIPSGPHAQPHTLSVWEIELLNAHLLKFKIEVQKRIDAEVTSGVVRTERAPFTSGLALASGVIQGVFEETLQNLQAELMKASDKEQAKRVRKAPKQTQMSSEINSQELFELKKFFAELPHRLDEISKHSEAIAEKSQELRRMLQITSIESQPDGSQFGDFGENNPVQNNEATPAESLAIGIRMVQDTLNELTNGNAYADPGSAEMTLTSALSFLRSVNANEL